MNAKNLVEKSPENIFRLKLLRKIFPNCRIIAIVRERESVGKSISRMETWYGAEESKWKLIKEYASKYEIEFKDDSQYSMGLTEKDCSDHALEKFI